MKITKIALILITLTILANIYTITVSSEGEPVIEVVYPEDGSIISDREPKIEAKFSDDETINEIIMKHSLEQSCEKLITKARKNGSTDDITLILIKP